MLVTAPYGRHAREGWGPRLSARVGWVLMESPALIALRKPGETGYRVPYGALHDLVANPNYLGEVIEWTGWAIATWSLAGASFALYTAANLVPRALANRDWLRERLPEYPRRRRAI